MTPNNVRIPIPPETRLRPAVLQWAQAQARERGMPLGTYLEDVILLFRDCYLNEIAASVEARPTVKA